MRVWDWDLRCQREFGKLPQASQEKLLALIDRYCRGEERTAEVKKIPGAKNLWELCAQADNGWPRVLFTKDGESCWGLTAFRKKTNKTEKVDLKRAKSRM